MSSKVTYTQTTFNGGEISPRLCGRTDFERYKSGLNLCENAIVLPQGGVVRRPGFQFIYEVKDSSKPVELIPFVFSEDQAYVLEFGDLYMRVFTDGGIVVTPDAYTVLLMHGDGIDSTISIVDDSPSGHTISPYGNAVVDTGQYKFASGSIIFDGSGDYLSIPDHANWNFGASEFTIDFWVYFDTVTGIHSLWSQQDAANDDRIWLFVDHEADVLGFQVVDNQANVVVQYATWAPVADTWYHVALVRGWGGVTNDWAICIDGTAVLEFTDSGTMPDHNQVVEIGGGLATTDIVDFSPASHTVTVNGDVVLSTAQAKFGKRSLVYDGVGDSLQCADHADWDICSTANAEVTISLWFYRPTAAMGAIRSLISQFVDADNRWEILIDASNSIQWIIRDTATTRLNLFTTWSVTADTWHHLALVKEGGTGVYGLWYDGYQILVGQYNVDKTFAGPLYVGSGTAAWNGYLEDILLDLDNRWAVDTARPVTDSSTASPYGVLNPSPNNLAAPQVIWSPTIKFGNGSLYFDGTNSYITASDNAKWDWPTARTIDFWVKHSDHAGNEGYISQHEDANNRWDITHVHGGGVGFEMISGGVTIVTAGFSSGEITNTSWHHILVAKNGDDWAVYVDSVLCGYAYDNSMDTFAGALYLAYSYYGAAVCRYQGYMDELRIQDDVTTADPQYWRSDRVSHGVSTMVSVPSMSVGTYKFGNNAVSMDGAADAMTFADHADWDILNQTNATVDVWVKHTDHVGNELYVGQIVDGDTFWILGHTHGTGIRFWVYGNDNLQKLALAGGEITDTNWHHIAVCKVGSDYGLYKDGVQVAYGSSADTSTFAAVLQIGGPTAIAGWFFDGLLDDLRITHANSFSAAPVVGLTDTITTPVAAHTADADTKLLMPFDYETFSLPTSEYTPDANTSLLLHMDYDAITVPTAPLIAAADTKLFIRADAYDLDGWLDEFRVSKGIARWTADFTPPTTEYPSAGGSDIYELVTTYTYDQVADLRTIQSADTIYLFHPDVNPHTLTRTDHDNWTITDIDWAPPPWNEINATATTLDASDVTGNITLTASAAFFDNTMVGCYFKLKNGYAKITSITSSTVANATVKDNLDDHVATADWYRSVWDLDQGYPTCGTFHEDRLVLAGQREHPLTVYFSRTGDYTDMAQAASAADDPFDATIWSLKQNQVKWLVSGKRLFLGTVGNEFWMTGSTVDTALAYNSIQAKPESSVGSEGVAPAVIDSAIFFVQDGGERVRMWNYTLMSDSYESTDISVLADHLTAYNPIYKLQYAQYPYSVLWATTYDGTLLGCTIMKSAQVFAWHHHTTGTTDTFETMAVIPGDNSDELWVVTARTIDSATVQYVERLNDDFYGTAIEDGVFMDSAISYTGSAETDFAGADHLEGETVQCLADGSYIGTKTIASGEFTLAVAATDVHVGIGYNTNIETLPWNASSEKGSGETTKKRIVNVMANVLETCELSFGKDSSNLLEYPMTNGTLYSQRFAQEHNGDWGYEPTIYFRQSYPFPMTLLSVSADIEVGGR